MGINEVIIRVPMFPMISKFWRSPKIGRSDSKSKADWKPMNLSKRYQKCYSDLRNIDKWKKIELWMKYREDFGQIDSDSLERGRNTEPRYSASFQDHPSSVLKIQKIYFSVSKTSVFLLSGMLSSKTQKYNIFAFWRHEQHISCKDTIVLTQEISVKRIYY